MATIRDVAREADVSIATVSRVLNKRGKYSKEIENRVIKTAEKLNYTINAGAKRLKTGITQLIAITIPEYYLLQYPEMLNCMIQYLFSNGFHTDILVNVNIYNLYKFIKEGRYDGIIVLNPEQDDKTVHKIIKDEVPAVFIGGELEREDINIIDIDFFQAGYLATRYLIKAGHKNIIFALENESLYASREIKRGYLFAHDEYGIQYSEENIIKIDNQNNTDINTIYFSDLFKNNSSFSAIFTIDYTNTLGALKSLNDIGIEVPEDVSLIACGENSKLKYLIPDLNMVILPIEQTAKLAAEMLTNSIINNDKVVKKIKLMVQIKKGKSVLKRLTKR